MKTILLTLIILLFWVGSCLAAPFLVCDPQAGVESYELEINGTLVAGLAAESDGSIRYDLAGLAEEDYGVRARAGNVWGWSEWSHTVDDPFTFTKALPQAPSGLRVSLE